MQIRTWPVLVVGFGTLLLLTVLSGLDSWRRAGQIYSTISSVHQTHARVEQALRDIESGIYLSGIYTRDFLLDLSTASANSHRQELREIQATMDAGLRVLDESNTETKSGLVGQLRKEVDGYWDTLEPIFTWTPVQKLALSTSFLRGRVLARREAVLNIAAEAKSINAADLSDRQQKLDRAMAGFRRSGQRTLTVALVLGLASALASIVWVSRLERRAEDQHRKTERAEEELRRLSRQLVRAQEDERRSLSRELHDQVGQTITALRVELGNVEKLRNAPPEEFRRHLDDAKELAAETLRSVRAIAMGLRPSVLDDLGVGPGIEWQGREFSRRTGIPVDVVIEGLPADVPDSHRTCAYRVVQEALTNCAKHAQASHIRIALHGGAGRLLLTVQDDGRGVPDEVREGRRGTSLGLGLIGIEERVRELGGSFNILSQNGKGTLLKISIPLPVEAKG
ncbi:MAG: sensor histidine kinase [Acidobacteriota bacterium]